MKRDTGNSDEHEDAEAESLRVKPPLKKVISINGEEVEASSFSDVNIHDFTHFEKEQLLTRRFKSTIRRRDGSESPVTATTSGPKRTFKQIVREMIVADSVLRALRQYNHNSDDDDNDYDDDKPAKTLISQVKSLPPELDKVPVTTGLDKTPDTTELDKTPDTTELDKVPDTTEPDKVPDTTELDKVPDTTELDKVPDTVETTPAEPAPNANSDPLSPSQPKLSTSGNSNSNNNAVLSNSNDTKVVNSETGPVATRNNNVAKKCLTSSNHADSICDNDSKSPAGNPKDVQVALPASDVSASGNTNQTQSSIAPLGSEEKSGKEPDGPVDCCVIL